jgi:hypothetical protein
MKGVGGQKNEVDYSTVQVETKDPQPSESKKVNRLLEIALQRPEPTTLNPLKGKSYHKIFYS